MTNLEEKEEPEYELVLYSHNIVRVEQNYIHNQESS